MKIQKNTLYQVSLLNALMQGDYDATLPWSDACPSTDIGLGTCQGLGGEMILLDSKAYLAQNDGTVTPLPKEEPVAFCTFAGLEEDLPSRPCQNIQSFAQLKTLLDEAISQNPNICYGVKLKGKFRSVLVRSVGRQEKPYPPLTEVAKHQNTFTYQNLTGTLVGFWVPAYLGQLNLPSWHLHFLSDDTTKGGHLLDCAVEDAQLQIQPLYDLVVRLPHTPVFAGLDLNQNLLKEAHAIEG